MKFLSLFTHPHVVLNLYNILSLAKKSLHALFHAMTMNVLSGFNKDAKAQ